MSVSHCVLLCGGSGARVKPASDFYNKALITLDDHFIIDYPIHTLISMGIKHITVILGGDHFADIVSYLQGGEKWGIDINYIFQKSPDGIAQAINLAKKYVENEDSFMVMLSDNIYSTPIVWSASINYNPLFSQIALYKHQKLNRFGVASIYNNKIVKIEEKPKTINFECSNYAITGTYIFNRDFFSMFKKLKKSARGEYEITSILQQYLDINELQYTVLDKHSFWGDAGTFESISQIRELIKVGKIKI